MVKLAIAGGSGQVAREIIDALLATRNHDITILTRNETHPNDDLPGIQRRVVDYSDQNSLVEALRGFHTLLSFIQPLSDPEGRVQKTLIDAAIAAGVKRFAPSEYGSAGTINMPWWSGKEKIREYLREVNTESKVLEYILFQPGLFLDYLAFPYKTSKHIDPLRSVFDIQSCRALMVEGHGDAVMTLTSAKDVAALVARAVDYQGQWPEVGGISGNRMSVAQIIATGEEIRGRPFTIEKVKSEDLEAGVLKTSWSLAKRHQSISEEQANGMATTVSIGILLSCSKGAWDVSNELNQLFPDHHFDDMQSFLTRVWDGKPEELVSSQA
ncbi:hypothetical protein PV08_09654 [Exophiala spinifera]|uniref:NmrA-like domain-containing protein n=1 Tax=Exophiala spinifera TaxID=91928 RepID=A0A0D1ZHH8_9EURO|nr:uncharacterized protein PV08_09654 [Exophiala spinifera]KIW12377.1 hypothetical protein PV08_09654 [Exophiala spinifera]